MANLAGAPLAHWPWTRSYQRTFTDSRVATTRTLAEAIASSDRKPAFVAQSGIAGYGDRGDRLVTEDTPLDADTFMAGVVRVWEAAAEPAATAGARVAVMRTGMILDQHGGAMKPLLLAFRAGLGGPVGSGEQYFSTISLPDWVRAATFLAANDEARGVYNVSGPNATTNGDFGRHLARMLHRPAALRVPAFPIRWRDRDGLLGAAELHPRGAGSAARRGLHLRAAHPGLPARRCADLRVTPARSPQPPASGRRVPAPA